jgi:hypothetical protein
MQPSDSKNFLECEKATAKRAKSVLVDIPLPTLTEGITSMITIGEITALLGTVI